MTRLDDDEARILTQARRALGPTSRDRQRVLQSLLPQLSEASGTTPRARSKSAQPSTAAWRLRAGLSIAAMGVIALSGGLGYRKGFQAGIAQQNSATNTPNPLLPAPAKPTPQAAPEPVLQSKVAPARALELARASGSVALATSAYKTLPAPPVARPPREPADTTDMGLDEEVRQLRRVERAIRESNPRLALVLLEELEQAIPAGQLLEEREAARIMASCQLDADAAVADARTFIARHRGSAYLSRVIEICRPPSSPAERISPVPGTDVPRLGD